MAPATKYWREDRGMPARDDADGRNQNSLRYEPESTTVLPVRPEADKRFRSDASGAPSRASLGRACRRLFWQRDESRDRERGHVGTEADEPEQCRDGGVVETAKTSHMSGLRNCGHTRMVLGYGKSQYASQGPPTWMAGKNSGAGHGKQRHGFGEAIDGVYARIGRRREEELAEMSGAGVADTDPPRRS